jgi:cobalt-zinc-cadmium efflux system protein
MPESPRQHLDGHGSGVPRKAGAQHRIVGALLLTGGFMLVEVVGGLLSGSLALLADAGHMLTDVGALALAYAGVRFAERPGDPQRTYGYARLEVLAAFTNGVALLGLAAWILIEAAIRFFEPVRILSGTMLVIALLGLVVNVASYLVLHSDEGDNINIQGAMVHVFGDILGSLAAIVAALVIRFTGWLPIDPLLSVLVACLIIRSGWDITRRSGHILLEGAPESVDRDRIRRDLTALPGVASIDHIHVWSLTSGRPLATLHVRTSTGADLPAVLRAAKERLRGEFGIDHSTIELEPAEKAEHTRRAGHVHD